MSDIPIEDQKEIVRERTLKEWNADEVDEGFYTEDYVMHDPLGDHTFADVNEMIEAVRSGTEDLQLRIDEGDKVVARYTMGGTNTGASYLIEEPTGKSWESSGIAIYRLEDGQIAEQWDSFSYLGTMQQLGLIPSDPPAASPYLGKLVSLRLDDPFAGG